MKGRKATRHRGDHRQLEARLDKSQGQRPAAGGLHREESKQHLGVRQRLLACLGLEGECRVRTRRFVVLELMEFIRNHAPAAARGSGIVAHGAR
eukprot:525481-Rhodomonas_salina.1